MCENVVRLSCATLPEDVKMNEKQHDLISTVMDMISDTLDNYEKDEHHAPAAWLLENWWCSLQACVTISFLNRLEDL